jgi:SAM-dependent methyltransferase
VTQSDHWFEPIADHLGRAYLRYSFTKGTEQEVDFLVDALELTPGQRVLDVGCGPGRHAHALARRGVAVHGVDISRTFVALAAEAAPPGATFERADARRLAFDGAFDAAISLCQGAFGLLTAPGEDAAVLTGIARALRPGGRLALSAFNAYFQIRYGEGDFDADTGINRERTEVRDEAGRVAAVDLWTHCFTPTELRALVGAAGLHVDDIWSVEPGAYARRPPTTESPEYLVLATK